MRYELKNRLDISESKSLSDTAASIMAWTADEFNHLLAQLREIKDPNKETFDASFAQLTETASAAHKTAIENSEKLRILMDATKEVDRNLDLRSLRGLELHHDARVLNFSDKDNWHRDTFSSKDEAANASLRLQFNLLVGELEDFEGVDEKAIAAINQWRTLNDMLALEDGVRRAMYGKDASGVALRRYDAAGGIKSLGRWKRYQELSRMLALGNAEADVNTGAGLEWVPTGVSFQLLPEIWPGLQLVNMFPTVAMSRSPMLYPVAPPFVEARLGTEALDQIAANNTAIAAQNIVTRNVTLTGRKFVLLNWFSSEIEEDSIVLYVATVRATGAFAIEAAKEDACLNGQASAISGAYGTFPNSGQQTSTFDSGTFTGTANNEDPRRAWDGIRYACSQSLAVEDASTGLTIDHPANARAKLGRWGIPEQCVLATGYKGLARFLTMRDAGGFATWLTAEKAGGVGTARSGVLGPVLGIADQAVSFFQSEDLSNAGVDIGGGGGASEAIIFNRNRWVLGTVRLTRVEILREIRADQDQIGAKFTHRCILKRTVQPATTDVAEAAVVGIRV